MYVRSLSLDCEQDVSIGSGVQVGRQYDILRPIWRERMIVTILDLVVKSYEIPLS